MEASSEAISKSETWKNVRLGTITKIRREVNKPDLPLLSVYLGRGVIPYSEGGKRVHPPSESLETYQEVRPGDIVLNNQQAWRGSVGVSRLHGIISPAYVVLTPPTEVHPGYSHYLFNSRVIINQFVLASKGVGSIQRDLHMPWLKNIRIPLPSLSYQIQATRHLDETCEKIDQERENLQASVELLKEFRERLVSDVITGQLDVRQKASSLPSTEPEQLKMTVDDVNTVIEDFGDFSNQDGSYERE